MKKSIVLAMFLFLSFMILSTGIAQQKADEKVVCPVSGETMLKSQAKASYVYEGKTYYFCCDDCKEKFVKDPAKYIGKNADMKEVYTCPMHPEVQSDKPGKCPKCGMTLVKKAMPMTHGQVVNFDRDEEGKAPKGFVFGVTGKGKPGVWIVKKDPTAPSAQNVLAQTDADPVSYRFPLCVYEGFSGRDVDVSVKYKPVSGKEDQAAGIVWRYQDHNNYYIVRANANENNVVLYKVENGIRTDLPIIGKGRTYGMKVRIPSGEWGTLRIVAMGSRFDVYSNGVKFYEVEDTTFSMAGKVGLWTKADSVTLFDDLTIIQQ